MIEHRSTSLQSDYDSQADTWLLVSLLTVDWEDSLKTAEAILRNHQHLTENDRLRLGGHVDRIKEILATNPLD